MSALQANPFLIAGGDDDYKIERSLRFNSGDNPGLTRTPSSAGNLTTWTWSGWVKRTEFGSNHTLFGAGTNSSNADSLIMFNAADQIEVWNYPGSYATRKITSAVFRDPSAFYHVVFSCNGSSYLKIYVNGVEQALSTNTGPNGSNWYFNGTSEHSIGKHFTGRRLNGYLADVHFIDGQALAPTDFGKFDNNGVWQAKEFAGTYGTNGFHLDFADNSSSAALGTDTSGNSNTWTVNNLSVAAGAGNDSLRDSPSQIADQSDTGAGGEVVGNYATLNPLDTNSNAVLSNGNLTIANGGYRNGRASIAFPSSGKWYLEAYVSNTTNSGVGANLGFATGNASLQGGYGGITNVYMLNVADELRFYNQTSVSKVSGYIGSGTILQLAFDADNSKAWIGINNVWRDSSAGTNGNPVTGANQTFSIPNNTMFAYVGGYSNTLTMNFGQRAFTYTAPSGYKCLCTANLPEPTIADGSQYFDTKLWTGNGTNQNISTSFSPDWVWVKERGGTGWNTVYDVVRGVKKSLITNDTRAEQTLNDGVTAFNSNSFTVSHDGASTIHTNSNGDSYVGWAWDAGSSTVSNTDGSITSQVRANPSAGFSIVKWAGNSTQPSTIGHGLNATPALIIAKQFNGTYSWCVFHESLGINNVLRLESSATPIGWTDTYPALPSSSVFTVGNWVGINGSGTNSIAYCFAPVEGYSTFGSYEGNGSTDGTFVNTGFKPQFVLIKCIDSGQHWHIFDSARGEPMLAPNIPNPETDFGISDRIDFVSNGFKMRTASAINNNNETHIFMAFAENPFKTSRAR